MKAQQWASRGTKWFGRVLVEGEGRGTLEAVSAAVGRAVVRAGAMPEGRKGTFSEVESWSEQEELTVQSPKVSRAQVEAALLEVQWIPRSSAEATVMREEVRRVEAEKYQQYLERTKGCLCDIRGRCERCEQRRSAANEVGI